MTLILLVIIYWGGGLFLTIWLIYLAAPGLSCNMQTLSCGKWDLVPWPVIEPKALNWEYRVLTSGLPGKSRKVVFMLNYWYGFESTQHVCFETLLCVIPGGITNTTVQKAQKQSVEGSGHCGAKCMLFPVIRGAGRMDGTCTREPTACWRPSLELSSTARHMRLFSKPELMVWRLEVDSDDDLEAKVFLIIQNLNV